MQVAGAGLGIGIRPERLLQDFAMYRIAGMHRQQAQHRPGSRLHRAEVNRATFDGDAKAAKAAKAQGGS